MSVFVKKEFFFCRKSFQFWSLKMGLEDWETRKIKKKESRKENARRHSWEFLFPDGSHKSIKKNNRSCYH
jgi:hypothetical protein